MSLLYLFLMKDPGDLEHVDLISLLSGNTSKIIKTNLMQLDKSSLISKRQINFSNDSSLIIKRLGSIQKSRGSDIIINLEETSQTKIFGKYSEIGQFLIRSPSIRSFDTRTELKLLNLIKEEKDTTIKYQFFPKKNQNNSLLSYNTINDPLKPNFIENLIDQKDKTILSISQEIEENEEYVDLIKQDLVNIKKSFTFWYLVVYTGLLQSVPYWHFKLLEIIYILLLNILY